MTYSTLSRARQTGADAAAIHLGGCQEGRTSGARRQAMGGSSGVVDLLDVTEAAA